MEFVLPLEYAVLFPLDTDLQKIQKPEDKILLTHRLPLRCNVKSTEQIFLYVPRNGDLIDDCKK